MYEEWNFREPPFQTTSLAADSRGDRLLVGRDQDVTKFIRLLSVPPRAVTVEGANGVGKTSLVNVAIYRALKHHIQTGAGPLFVPALDPLQLREDHDLEEFLDSVYFLLARSLIHRAREVAGFGWGLPSTRLINEWLNSPMIERLGANLGPVGLQRSAEMNENAGYVRGAFRAEIRDWLVRVFPNANSGGVVCLIDNLELLRTSARARQFVENLRDPLFGINGVRWVLCGANGITRSVAGSARLDGYLHDPIDVLPLEDLAVNDIFTSRVEAFSVGGRVPYLPLRVEDFVSLFETLGSNTRSTLRYADSYCLAQADDPPQAEADKADRFSSWLSGESRTRYEDCREQVGNRAWLLFDRACEDRSDFGPGDYERFGFNNSQAMVPHVTALETTGLVVSAIDETDRRRRTISITPKGWLVRLARTTSTSQ